MRLSILLIILLFSCNNSDKQLNVNNTSEAKKIFFKLSPLLNKAYQYEISNTTEISQEVKNEKVENTNKLELGIGYTFLKDSAGNLSLAMQYNKFKLSVKAMGEERELDAATAAGSFIPSEKMFAAFNNASLVAILDSMGNAKSLTGYKEINDKMYQLANGDADAVQMLNGSIKQYVNEAFFKQTTEQSFKFFTNRQLKVGDTISQSIPINTGFNFNIRSVYKLVSIKDDIANINVGANIEITEQPITVEGTNVIATLKGSQSGEINIDIRSGILQNSSSELKINGILKVAENDVPIKLRMTSTTKLVQ